MNKTTFTRETAPVIPNAGNYHHLRALRPEAYLRPENFITDFDKYPENQARATAQYQEGLRIGRTSRKVFICCNGTWAAEGRDGSHLSSYEGIGYHANTAALLSGFLDSGATIVVCRYSENGGGPRGFDSAETMIQEGAM